MRRYTHGSRWAFWRWTYIYLPDGPRFEERLENLYLRRLHLVKTPRFAVMLHWILLPDYQRHLHDHPVAFLSIVLRGGYDEARPRRVRRIRWFNLMRATDCHRIYSVRPGTLTLVFAGPKVREWGFHTEDGWVGWRDYRRTGRTT